MSKTTTLVQSHRSSIAHLTLNRTVWMLTAVATLVASIAGLVRPAIYEPVVSEAIMPGVFTQDLLAAVAAAVIIILALTIGNDSAARPIIILGLLGFLFYAYGIYAIEQVYTLFYPLYLAIFALSFYGMALGLASLQKKYWSQLSLAGWLRNGAAAYAIFVAIMFNVIWLSQLAPLLQEGNRIEYTFSIYIIDLSFIMPAMAISGILALRRHTLGIVGLPALFILGLGILSPLALAELIKPARYGLPTDPGGLWLFGSLSLIFLALTVLYLVQLKPTVSRRGTSPRTV
ncbi:MAG: hypothetical protein ACOCXI_04465 [Chloroflexota bacterium]